MERSRHIRSGARVLGRLTTRGAGTALALAIGTAAIGRTTSTHRPSPARRGGVEGLRAAAAQATLRRIATAIAEGGTLDELLERVVHEGRILLDAQRVEVAVNDPRAGSVWAGTGAQGLREDDAARGTAALVDRRRPRTLVAAIPGRGTRQAFVVADGACSPDADLLIDELARLAGLAQARADEHARLHALARTDALTGLRNRRAFDERLADEVTTARRFGRPLSLAILDIDRFKRVNDEFGHMAGDETLRAVCGAVAAQARVEDLVARIGGEEIAWLMPGAAPPAARVAGERALDAIRDLGLPVGCVTASCGLSQLRRSDANGCDVLRRADCALYEAKAAGRNRLALG